MIPALECQVGWRRAAGLDWLTLAFAGAMIIGGYGDAWGLQHAADTVRFSLDALVGAGWLAVTALSVWMAVRALLSGVPWRRALPAGYQWAFVGCISFGVGVVGDPYYRDLAGPLNGLEQLFAPASVLEVAGAALIAGAPLRRAICSGQPQLGWAAVVSAAMFLAVIRFDLLWTDPAVLPWPAIHDGVAAWWVGQDLGTAALLIESFSLAAIAAYLFAHFDLRPGALSIVCVITGGLSCLVQARYQLYPVMALTGVAADCMVAGARRRRSTGWALGLAVVVSVTHALLYWLAIDLLIGGDGWTMKLWLGEVLTAAAAGWLAGVLVTRGPLTPRQLSVDEGRERQVTAADVRDALSMLTDDLALAGSGLGAAMVDGSELDDSGGPRRTGRRLRELMLATLREMTEAVNPSDAEAAKVVEAMYVRGLSSRQIEPRFHLSRATVYRRAGRGVSLLAAALQQARDTRSPNGKASPAVDPNVIDTTLRLR